MSADPNNYVKNANIPDSASKTSSTTEKEGTRDKSPSNTSTNGHTTEKPDSKKRDGKQVPENNKTPATTEPPSHINSTPGLNQQPCKTPSKGLTKPTATLKINITGFKNKNPQKLRDTLLLLDPALKSSFDYRHYPDPKVVIGTNGKPFAVYSLPKHVALRMIAKSGSQGTRGTKLTITSHNGDTSSSAAVITGLPQSVTLNDIKDHLKYVHDEHFDKIQDIALNWDQRTHTKTCSFHVPLNEYQFFLTPIVIDGRRFQIAPGHPQKPPTSPLEMPKPPQRQSQKKSNLKFTAPLELRNRFAQMTSDQGDDEDEEEIGKSEAFIQVKTKARNKTEKKRRRRAKINATKLASMQEDPMETDTDTNTTIDGQIDLTPLTRNATDPTYMTQTPEKQPNVDFTNTDWGKYMQDATPHQQTFNNDSLVREEREGTVSPYTMYLHPDIAELRQEETEDRTDHGENREADHNRMESPEVDPERKDPMENPEADHTHLESPEVDLTQKGSAENPEADHTCEEIPEVDQSRTEQVENPEEDHTCVESPEVDRSTQNGGTLEGPEVDQATVENPEVDHHLQQHVDEVVYRMESDRTTLSEQSDPEIPVEDKTQTLDDTPQESPLETLTATDSEPIQSQGNDQIPRPMTSDGEMVLTQTTQPPRDMVIPETPTSELETETVLTKTDLTNNKLKHDKRHHVDGSSDESDARGRSKVKRRPRAQSLDSDHARDLTPSNMNHLKSRHSRPKVTPTNHLNRKQDLDIDFNTGTPTDRHRDRSPLTTKDTRAKSTPPAPRVSTADHRNLQSLEKPPTAPKDENSSPASQVLPQKSKVAQEELQKKIMLRKFTCSSSSMNGNNNKVKKAMKERGGINPRDLLEVLIHHKFNFAQLSNQSRHEFKYTPQEREKLTALLMFYYISHEEEAVREWPTQLGSLPHTIKYSWIHFCRQFKNRDASNSWQHGPPEMDKYISIGKDIVYPATFDGHVLRRVAKELLSHEVKFSPKGKTTQKKKQDGSKSYHR